jgi:hypothetical protein
MYDLIVTLQLVAGILKSTDDSASAIVRNVDRVLLANVELTGM